MLLGFFVYSRIVERVFGIHPENVTPAYEMQDGVDYVPMGWGKIFLIQFLNIAGPRLKKYGVLEAERMQTTPAPQGPVVGARSTTPRGAAPSGPQPPAAAVQSLLRGEGTDEQFDAVFGSGAAARARGR